MFCVVYVYVCCACGLPVEKYCNCVVMLMAVLGRLGRL